MDLEDMSHIRKISEALWSDAVGSRAAVMIGTGFSANADKVSQSTADMPMWNTLRKDMLADLGMEDLGQDALAVADLYESSFGKSQLEAFLMKKIPDHEFKPGDLHELLLKLPWSDVFTTNYDTLLERASEKIIERRYSCVYSAEDIPLSRPPRIVKLHGTFQRNRPLVFSSEDYRTYPVKSAPFVNLVQESIMENIFCLLGFSGSDPNFLQWIGWVRDNLKAYQPMIYLCGLLDMSIHERKRLERINVQPIDLTPIYPKDKYPNRRTRYRMALMWFLQELQKGEPNKPENWPFFPNEKKKEENKRHSKSCPSFLDTKSSTEEYLSMISKEIQAGREITPELLEGICRKFQSVRESYPGWIVAPYSVRKALYNSTREWYFTADRVLQKKNISLVLKLHFLYEIEWRASVALYFMDGAFLAKAIEVMEMINPFPRHITLSENCLSLSDKIENADWEEVGAWWVSLAFAVVRFARMVQDLEIFQKWNERLEAIHFLDEEWDMQWHYEQCMETLFLLDRKALLSELEEWDVSKGQPLWKIRMASLLAEAGNVQSARDLIEKAIAEIRERESSKTKSDIRLLSEEGCGLALARLLSLPSLSFTAIQERLKILDDYQSNPLKEIENLRMRIRNYQPEQNISRISGYDPGTVIIQRTFHSNSEHMFDAVNMFYIFEVAALPIQSNSYVTLTEITKAVEWLRPVIFRAALVMIMRKGDVADLSKYFSRSQVANFSQEEVDSLYSWFYQCLYRSYHQISTNRPDGTGNVFLINTINMSITILSYLSFRVSDVDIRQLYDILITIFRENVILSFRILASTIDTFIKRLLYCSKKEIIKEYALPLISLPVHLDCPYYESGNDPIVYLLEFHSDKIGLECRDNVKWGKTIENLVHSSRNGSGLLRRISILRLTWLYRNNMLTENECDEFGKALWSGTTETGDIPNDTGLYMFQLLGLPSPSGDAMQRYKTYIEKNNFGTFNLRSSESVDSTQPVIYSMNCVQAVRALRSDEIDGARKYITWSKEEAAQLLKKVNKFWEIHSEQIRSSQMDGDIFFSKDFCIQRAHDVMVHVCKVFGRLVLPYITYMNQSELDEARRIFEEMKGSSWSMVMLPFQRYICGDTEREIMEVLNRNLLSNNSQNIEDALSGIYEWVNFLPPEGTADIRDGVDLNLLIDQMVDHLYMRKAKCLNSVMQYMVLLVRHHKDFIFPNKERLKKLTDALAYMLDDIIEDNDSKLGDEGGAEYTSDYLLHYQACGAELAYYVVQCCYEGYKVDEIPEALKKWMEFCKQSVLPEVHCWSINA